MAKRLTPYGSAAYRECVAKVGKTKAVARLVARMPSAEIAAKVGGGVVDMKDFHCATKRQVVRKNAQGAKIA